MSQKRPENMDNSRSSITGSSQNSYLHDGLWLSSTSLELLKHYETKENRLRNVKLQARGFDTSNSAHQNFSADSIMKLAKQHLLQIKSRRTHDLLSLCGPESQPDLPSEVSEDLELALLLHAAAEKVANGQWIHAQKLLNICDISASQNGNPVQRVVHYFAEALRWRIHRKSGEFNARHCEIDKRKAMDVKQAEIHLQPEMMACQQELPFRLLTQSTGIQAILDALESSRRVHLIDFGIDNGSHWILIMQHFSVRYDCPLESLKITAVGSCKEMLEMTGHRLSSFAESLGLPFSFLVVVSDLKDLKENDFVLKSEEVVAVYSVFCLWTQLAWPNHLKALLGVIRNLKPCVLVVQELEGSTNSTNFLDRFDEALYLFSALFDILETCMEHRIIYRRMTEEVIYRETIRNILTAEGSERVYRHERIGFWRKFLTNFGMEETDLSSSSICHATLLLRRSTRFNSCKLGRDGKSFILG